LFYIFCPFNVEIFYSIDDKNLNLGIKKNYMSFAGSGPNSRGTQVFIAFSDLNWLGPRLNDRGEIDGSWETPFAKVVDSDSVLEALYKGDQLILWDIMSTNFNHRCFVFCAPYVLNNSRLW